MKRYFCTYLDQHYLPRGLALYRSLRRVCSEFSLFVLCMDRESAEALTRLDLPSLHPIGVEDFLRDDPALRQTQTNRSRVEFYFTCSPSWPLFLLNRFPDIDLITYLDADLYFYSNSEPIFTELGAKSIGIIEHRFPPSLAHCVRAGIYNVGWLTFRRDAAGLECLHWWRERCLEWCFDRWEDGRYADQKYLDDWPTRFPNVIVLRHKGANLAPWNVANYTLSRDERGLWVDEQPLVFYHFHALKQTTRWLFNSHLSSYGAPSPPVLRKHIYFPYIRAVRKQTRRLARVAPAAPVMRSIRHAAENTSPKSVLARLKPSLSRVHNLLRLFRSNDTYFSFR